MTAAPGTTRKKGSLGEPTSVPMLLCRLSTISYAHTRRGGVGWGGWGGEGGLTRSRWQRAGPGLSCRAQGVT